MEAAAALPQTELVSTDLKPQEISFALPKALHTTAHIHLTVLERCATVFITSSTPGDSAGSLKPLGSFVYAMPDRTNSKSAISTTLYTTPSSIEYATRVAKIVARRIGVPVYVGCSIDPNGLGLTVEEEMEGLKRVVDIITETYESSKKP